MSPRNKVRESIVDSRRLQARRHIARHRGASRRGVLLLVVLSLLVLFMLIGTAFLMSSNQYRKGAKATATLNAFGTPPTRLLDRALMQVLCDTGNPRSVIRYHSLLRDLYGSDGFEAHVYSPTAVNLMTPVGQVARFAGATADTLAQMLGPTQGQFVDIYAKVLTFGQDDPATTGAGNNEALLVVPDTRHGLMLELNVNGQRQPHQFPLTKGYYNGCLLTVTSGPAAGQSTRVLDYETAQLTPATLLLRFRVMAFPRSDGLPLQINASRAPEIGDLAGATFIVNGRPFNGTGAGYNELAVAGQPRLSAVERVQVGTAAPIFAEVALTPNAVHTLLSDPAEPGTDDTRGVGYFAVPGNPLSWTSLNPTNITGPNRPLRWKYQTFVGPGDADESYDAPDFQNMALAMQTVSPRATGRVVTSAGTFEINDPAVLGNNGVFNQGNNFLRLDLEDLPIPSYHRPDLLNYWFHRLLLLISSGRPLDFHVRAILHPYGEDGIRDNAAVDPSEPTNVPLDVRDQIVALKRKISLRPIREDHPNFDGSNPASRGYPLSNNLVRNNQIAVPYWEAVGPWDVDNDNDGVPDSVWVDLGDPVAQAADGTLYKPLYAFLIIDLDSRLNVNAHGLVDHLQAPDFAMIRNPNPSSSQPLMIPGPNLANMEVSNVLPHGIGYGPAEISLRPILSPNLPGSVLAANVGNPGLANLSNADDYARLLLGRPQNTSASAAASAWGRHGSLEIRGGMTNVRPGVPYLGAVFPGTVDPIFADRLAQFKFFGYPVWLSDYYGSLLAIPLANFYSAFSNPPDLMGRYALGLDHVGQPVVEQAADTFAYGNRPLLVDSPYELNLSDPARRGKPAPAVAATINATPNAPINDDAPFATAELERILRAYDADAGVLPDRLWNLVDAFDPIKLIANQPAAVDAKTLAIFGSTGNATQRLAAAQQLASENRHLVTTESYDLPVPGSSFLKRLVYGADGQPGVAGEDDDGNGIIDDATELGWMDSDDYHPVLTGAAPADAAPTAPILTPRNPTIVDLLKYRVQFERRRRTPSLPNFTEAELNLVVEQLLAPEVIAGQRMDLNRPFGDGQDNAGNGLDDNGNGLIDEPGEAGDPFSFADGVVDDPFEAGEPFVDSLSGPNQNGRWDPGEEYYDLDKNGAYTPPRDQLWQGLLNISVGFSYNHAGVVTDGRLMDVFPKGSPDGVPDGRLRQNGIILRQTYARHLYSLMMLLVDENYLATQNVAANSEGNINLEGFFNDLWFQVAQEIAERNGRSPIAPSLIPTPIQADFDEAKPIATKLAFRKLTAKRIAQWAINVVDFRDADSIMTPFEYDENPFDGWGVFARDPANPTNTTTPPIFVPIDGDLATNENWGSGLPYPTKFNPNVAPTAANGNNPYDDPRAENASRGVVWGAERPELLITETLAIHDRRCTDEIDTGTQNESILQPSSTSNPDFDLDQKLKPRGALYLEFYNPWTADGNKPAELFSEVAPTPGKSVVAPTRAEGVMLNRLSNFGSLEPSTGEYKRSPVWRVAVVRDLVDGKLMNEMLTSANRDSLMAQVLTSDVDGYGFDSDEMSERLVYFTTGGDTNREDDNELAAEYQVNTANGTITPKLDNPNLRVRVPPMPVNPVPVSKPFPRDPAARRYFIARTQLRQPGSPANDQDVPIAPILPGRYAVVGASGVQIDSTGAAGTTSVLPTTRFVLPLSRWSMVNSSAGNSYQPDSQHLNRTALLQTRRFELVPSTDPNQQQLLIGENGGPELVSDGTNLVNVTDANRDGVPDSMILDPCIAIPVEDLNISEPVEGYPTQRYATMYQDPNINPSGTLVPLNQKPQLNAYGEYEYQTPYNRPLDLEPETTMNGTTQNYRSVHLQRLANPMFPWNPPQYDEDGNLNGMHHPELPINPYLTIDSQSVDLTAYNGATELERTNLPVAALPPPAPQPGNSATPNEDLFQSNYLAPLSAGDYFDGPDHVLAGLIRELVRWGILSPRGASWITVEQYRGRGEDAIRNDLTALERAKGGNVEKRSELEGLGIWRWHEMPRTMPDDQVLMRAASKPYDETLLMKRFHLKSLERGAHFLGLNDTLQWQIADAWQPRVLWKQERPNISLSISLTQILSDLKNVRSRRVLMSDGTNLNPVENRLRDIDHYTDKDLQIHNYFTSTGSTPPEHVIDFVVEQTLGFSNEAYAPNVDRTTSPQARHAMLQGTGAPRPGAPEITSPNNLSNPEAGDLNRWNTIPAQTVVTTTAQELQRRQRLLQSTYPWFPWNDRPFVSAEEIMQVPASSSSLMLREYAVTNRFTANPYDGDGLDSANPGAAESVPDRIQRQSGNFGHLLNFFLAADRPADVLRDPATGQPILTPDNQEQPIGAPNWYRIFDFVEVPSRYVGTETLLSPTVFRETLGFNDPRNAFRPPFNKISRERDPGRVNLNTVTGRRVDVDPVTGRRKIWSEVYDGIMHRYGDNNLLVNPSVANPVALQLSHFGPAWRDVALSRRGYAQYNADGGVDPVEKTAIVPDTFANGLNRQFPSMFSNPFRSADAGDLVPLANMVRPGVEATYLRGHHWLRADDATLLTNPFAQSTVKFPNGIAWGIAGVDDDGNGIVDDVREAGFGIFGGQNPPDGDALRVVDSTMNQALASSGIPLFSEQMPEPAIDGERNPGMMYQPMTRLGNLVTTRSNVYAIWVTVGYFEVERAPDWNDSNNAVKTAVRARFGATNNDTDAATLAGRAMYDRVYPEGYMLGEEMGTDTGNTRRQRAFYIIDRTEPVGFKPGEELNVERMIRVRRRIE